MRQDLFLDVLPPAEAARRWQAALDLPAPAVETVPLGGALGRVLAADVAAPGNVPAFDRANMDGFAVRAEDTWGASERTPARLRLRGEVAAGPGPLPEVAAGTAVAVATGARVPRGADAVVPVEDTDLHDDGDVLVRRSAGPGARISAAGSDVTAGEVLMRRGTVLTARETGTLAAAGVATVPCARRPRVAVISTGDEIVAPGTPLVPGQVHDANATLLADAVREAGAEAFALGIAPDEEGALGRLLDRALADHDVVLLSGGTSKGPGDLGRRLLARRARIVVHGVAIKPGKPLCLAVAGGRPVAVLPGFPTSAIFTFHAFVAPVLRRLLGLGARDPHRVEAVLPRRVASEAGREEYTLVNLVPGRTGLLAWPLGTGSGSVTTFARADGFFRLDADTEHADAGERVAVTLLGRGLEPADLVVLGSHCTGLETVLAAVTARGLTVKTIWAGSRGGLEAARLGACDVAPVHLYDRATDTYNAPFVTDGLELHPGYGRRQGLAYRPEDAARLGTDGAAGGVEAVVRAVAADRSLRLANRNPASGTHALLEAVLAGTEARPPGWASAYVSHRGVAAAIAQGRADWGLCLEAAAREAGLAWRPLRDERYDLLVPADRRGRAGVEAFLAALASGEVRAALRAQGFSA